MQKIRQKTLKSQKTLTIDKKLQEVPEIWKLKKSRKVLNEIFRPKSAFDGNTERQGVNNSILAKLFRHSKIQRKNSQGAAVAFMDHCDFKFERHPIVFL